jgi:hypothetical protein
MAWGLIAAAIGSQLIGGASSIIGGKKAADASVEAAQIAAQQQRESLETALKLGRPQMEVGQSALATLAGLFGLQAPTPIDFDNLTGGTFGELSVTDSLVRGKTVDLPRTGGLSRHQVIKGFREFAGREPTETELEYYDDGKRADQFFDNFVRPVLVRQEQERQKAAPAGGGGAAGTPDVSSLTDLITNNPGIQFVRDQGERAISRAAAARGLNQSGGTLEDLTEFNSGLASTNFQNLVLNPLFQLAGFGNQQTQAGQQLVTGTGTNLANLALNAGNARASSFQNAGNTVGNTFGDLGQLLLLKEFGAFA